MDLAEVRGIISGAAGELGREFALQLLRAGAWVYAGDINAAGLRVLRSMAAEAPGRLFLGTLDITNEVSVETFTSRACAEMGEINTLINCVGILRDGYLVSLPGEGKIRKMTAAQWKQVIDVNLTGSFYMAREVASVMMSRGTKGVVVNISSICHKGNAGQANYSASKAAMNAAARSWALELAPYGVRFGTIAPGVIDTNFLRGVSDQAQRNLLKATPLGRLGMPYDVWLAVRFIIECEFFTGRMVEVDGGADISSIL